MSLPTHLTTNVSHLPFYCSTNALSFYLGKRDYIEVLLVSIIHILDDPTTFSQVLTLYNPYDFVVRYKGKSIYISSN